jgi:hypothetical protein
MPVDVDQALAQVDEHIAHRAQVKYTDRSAEGLKLHSDCCLTSWLTQSRSTLKRQTSIHHYGISEQNPYQCGHTCA